jgi:hypothetical protein
VQSSEFKSQYTKNSIYENSVVNLIPQWEVLKAFHLASASDEEMRSHHLYSMLQCRFYSAQLAKGQNRASSRLERRTPTVCEIK